MNWTKVFKRNYVVTSFVFFLLFTNAVQPQSTSREKGTRDASPATKGTEAFQLPLGMRDFFPSLDTTSVHDTRSPGKATLLSAVLPGLGQIYTKSYWKLPIIWGLGGYYVHGWIKNNNRYRDFRDQYMKSLESSAEGDLQLRNLRDFYHNQRDSYAWYFGILYLANLVDASVTASLYDFDVSDDLSVGVGQAGNVLMIRWKW